MTRPETITARTWKEESEIKTGDVAFFALSASGNSVRIYNAADGLEYYIRGADPEALQAQLNFIELEFIDTGRVFINPDQISAIYPSRHYRGAVELLVKEQPGVLRTTIPVKNDLAYVSAHLGLPSTSVAPPRPPQVG